MALLWRRSSSMAERGAPCPWTYPPVRRMLGKTSAVTQRRNYFAPGSLLGSTSEYSPDSLMMVISCSSPGV